MSVFDELEAAASAAVSETFADRAIFTPRLAASQWSERATDPDRSEGTICGVLSEAVTVDTAMKEKIGPAMTDAALAAEFWIEAKNIPAERPQKGDALSFPDRSGAPVYNIARLDPTDRGDLNCILTRENE